MDINLDTLEVRNNAAAERFELALGDDVAVIDYHKRNNLYMMIHTEVPEQYSGRGVANKLVHDALEMVRKEGAKVLPYCPFVKAYLRRHPEYQDLIGEPPEYDENY